MGFSADERSLGLANVDGAKINPRQQKRQFKS